MEPAPEERRAPGQLCTPEPAWALEQAPGQLPLGVNQSRAAPTLPLTLPLAPPPPLPPTLPRCGSVWRDRCVTYTPRSSAAASEGRSEGRS